MKKLIVISFVCASSFAFTQNLVPNPSFEDYTSCAPMGQFDSLLNWFNPCIPPYSPSGSGSPDYYNSCNANFGVPSNWNGYQYAHSGDKYVGIIIYGISGFDSFREYIEVQLTSPLIAEKCYYFQMYVNLSNQDRCSADTIGAYFSDTIVAGLYSHLPLFYIPQIKNNNGIIIDTYNWTLIDGSFMAHGGESYLIIGNFNDNMHSDTIQFSTSICTAYFFIDDVSLVEISCDLSTLEYNNKEIIIYPNPTTGKFLIKNEESRIKNVSVNDIYGKEVLKSEVGSQKCEVDLSSQPKGIYIIKVQTSRGVVVEKIVLE